MASKSSSVSVSLPKLAGLIDHALLHPTLTDADLAAGCALARDLGVAAVCVPSYAMAETAEALRGGASEIDVVVNVAKVLGGAWHYVEHEIDAVNRLVSAAGGALKVIFENDYLDDHHIVRLCEICTRLRVAFVKTSTGFGFVKQPDGSLASRGATLRHVELMRLHAGPDVQIKASGGIRNLDQILQLMSMGVTRVGASATQAIMDEARARGIGEEEMLVEVGHVKGQ
ncbi:hypothetical protein HIM_10796 [Hirsutella minnesotensis 3608]|uniref:Uncharacterized protein n=1 Tax=Hirsutella minnesotensis 3608 TaxID=1043627 RepID=A0A0F7ZWZ2_9HYPO|nr:hypothetical protein HIM_10796 [Hirsutella minnesotensis 3608]